ncbi:MAG: hypothetical protein PHR35_19625 [Kiritimatiellae bacterium]|nr:hypothetical protein [Kiritimatiellia bacterium]
MIAHRSCALAFACLWLSGAVSLMAGPKVMILVDEKSLGTVPTSEIEAMAVGMLAERQVQTVDQDMLRANLKKRQDAMRAAGDGRGAAALGREFGADVVILGEAVAKPSARRIGETNLRSYQAAVTLRAVRTDTAVNLASASEDATVVALDDVGGSAKALKTAGAKRLESLLPAMLAKWSREVPEPVVAADQQSFEVTVGGLDQVWKLKAVRDRLRANVRQATSTTQRSYAQGMAVFQVATPLPAEELAEALVLTPPEGLKMQVVEIAPGSISLRAVEATP